MWYEKEKKLFIILTTLWANVNIQNLIQQSPVEKSWLTYYYNVKYKIPLIFVIIFYNNIYSTTK